MACGIGNSAAVRCLVDSLSADSLFFGFLLYNNTFDFFCLFTPFSLNILAIIELLWATDNQKRTCFHYLASFPGMTSPVPDDVDDVEAAFSSLQGQSTYFLPLSFFSLSFLKFLFLHFLLPFPSPFSPLLLPTGEERIELFQFLCPFADIGAKKKITLEKDIYGNTFFHFAALSGILEMVEEVLREEGGKEELEEGWVNRFAFFVLFFVLFDLFFYFYLFIF